jgi:hypothetical protein
MPQTLAAFFLPAAALLAVAAAHAGDHQSAFGFMDEKQQAEMLRCGVDAERLDAFLRTDQQTFDQTFEGEATWRTIGQSQGLDDCGVAQAAVIEAYLLFSKPHPVTSQKILRWHAGQALAGAGTYSRALAFFRGTYDEYEYTAWNDYVDATIAFLEGDRDALISARDSLAKKAPSAAEIAEKRAYYEANPDFASLFEDWETKIMKPMNMDVVEALMACFGRPYSEAYGTCELSE